MKYETFKRAAFALVAMSVLAVFGCQIIQRKLLFYPSHHANANGFTRWEHDGQTIGYVREAADPKNVWMLLHGNGGQAADRQYAMYAFDRNDSVFILEYPGFGGRTGTPSRRSIDAAARAGYADLRARFPGRPVCVAGESLGSGPASVLSGESPPPDKIVLVVPFDSIKSVGKDHAPALLVHLVLAGTWNNVEALQRYHGPIEIFGAEDDEVIPVKHARALAASVPHAQFQQIRGNHGWANQPDVQFRCP
jgi:pimeloyl-ACP methyl ester carboxylesterase